MKKAFKIGEFSAISGGVEDDEIGNRAKKSKKRGWVDIYSWWDIYGETVQGNVKEHEFSKLI